MSDRHPSIPAVRCPRKFVVLVASFPGFNLEIYILLMSAHSSQARGHFCRQEGRLRFSVMHRIGEEAVRGTRRE